MGPTDKSIVTQKLKCLSEYILTVPRWMEMSCDGVMGRSINDNNLLLSAAILYVTEAYLPLVSAFCKESATHMSERKNKIGGHCIFDFSAQNIAVLMEVSTTLVVSS